MAAPVVAGFARPECAQQVCSWRFARNCQLPPARLIAVTCAAPLLGVAPGLLLALLGYPYVALFALVQTIAVLIAVLLYGRHAVDGERLSVGQGRVSLTVYDGLRETHESWGVQGVRLWRAQAEDSVITLYAGGQPHLLAAHVRAEQRRALEREIRQALEAEQARASA
jgi:uncharacterized membrane protein